MKEGNPNIDDRIFKTKEKITVRDLNVIERMIRTSGVAKLCEPQGIEHDYRQKARIEKYYRPRNRNSLFARVQRVRKRWWPIQQIQLAFCFVTRMRCAHCVYWSEREPEDEG
jgi:hypothetical protein